MLIRLLCCGAWLAALGSLGSVQGAKAQTSVKIADVDQPLLFAYGTWQDRVRSDGKMLVIRGEGVTNQGGGGMNVSLDLAAQGDCSPALRVRIGPGNQAAALRLMLSDDQGNKATWTFDLPDRPGEATLTPRNGASLGQPNEQETRNTAPLDLGRINQWQLIGDWAGGKALDLDVLAVTAESPDEAIRAARAARDEREEAARAKAAQAKDDALAAIRHTPASPAVERIAPVAPHLLEITIQEGQLQRFDPVPYVAQPGDEIRRSDGQALAWENSQLISTPEKRSLVRTLDGKPQTIGYIVGGRDGDPLLLPFEQKLGDELQTLTVDDLGSYRVSSADDPSFREPLTPRAVYRKSKPTDRVMPDRGQLVRHQVYLELPHPLQDGATYTIAFPGVNTRQPTVDHAHRPRHVRSSAIHVSHIGYRPDDPFKRGFLSLWLGTGGPHTYEEAATFQLLSDADAVVFEGPVQLVLPVDGKEQVRVEKNLSGTAVYALDFSAFTQPGEYRVFVPGVGCSYPVLIGRDAWAAAFKLSMHGFLVQRSGLALGPPVTDFRRPRDFHPADGVKVFQSRASAEQAYATDNWFRVLADQRTDETLDHAWGGYHDAGDFDRAINHLWATYLHLELLDLFPDYYRELTLALPAEEAEDALPDVLNEALWNLELYRRLQTADGGVSGGVESSAHPRPGETSWQDSLAVFAFAPDVGSSYTYAAVAGRAARLLQRHDSGMAQVYRDSATRAWMWAEQRRHEATGHAYGNGSPRDLRCLAAAELLWLTSDPAYDAAFRDTTRLHDPGDNLIDQQGAVFTYARLPEGVGDAGLKAQARHRLIEQAEHALRYAEGNAFGLTIEVNDMPLIGPVGAFTTPGMVSQVLPRVHYLTGEARYLAGTVRACNFSAGANPDNMTMTTGVGYAAPRAPLHMDSRWSNQPAPAGLTVYGPYDADSLPNFAAASDWVHTWFLSKSMVPNSRTWPTTESYVDFFLWPMMNEFTIKQNMGPTSYYWGYLAARP